jgi:hypothetical protein
MINQAILPVVERHVSCGAHGFRASWLSESGALKEQFPLTQVARQRCRVLELRAGLGEAAEPGEGSQRTVGKRWWPSSDGSAVSPSTSSKPACGPKAMATATARFNSTTENGASWERKGTASRWRESKW